MNNLLEKINETFDNSINNANDDLKLQLKILKSNINLLFNEAMEGDVMDSHVDEVVTPVMIETPVVPVTPEVPKKEEKKIIYQFDANGVVISDNSDELFRNMEYVRNEPEEELLKPTTTPIESFDAVNEVNDSIENKTILIVDDSIIIRNYLKKAIGDKYNTISVSGGAEAIEAIPNNKVDMILLDLMMPGVDGFGVLDYIKAEGITAPVIIISGDTTKETIDRAFTYNVLDMIEKPFSDKVIMDKINRVLE